MTSNGPKNTIMDFFGGSSKTNGPDYIDMPILDELITKAVQSAKKATAYRSETNKLLSKWHRKIMPNVFVFTEYGILFPILYEKILAVSYRDFFYS